MVDNMETVEVDGVKYVVVACVEPASEAHAMHIPEDAYDRMIVRNNVAMWLKRYETVNADEQNAT